MSYQQDAERTEFTPLFVHVYHDVIGLDGEKITFESGAQQIRLTSRLFHAAMGMCTESGEFMDALKKHAIYGKPLDLTNLVEEAGDCLWYIALMLNSLGVTVEDAMARNISKLRARYPEAFTSERALERDLDAERKALEQK